MSNDVLADENSVPPVLLPVLFPVLTVKQPSPFPYLVCHLVSISGFPVNTVGFELRFLILIPVPSQSIASSRAILCAIPRGCGR